MRKILDFLFGKPVDPVDEIILGTTTVMPDVHLDFQQWCKHFKVGSLSSKDEDEHIRRKNEYLQYIQETKNKPNG